MSILKKIFGTADEAKTVVNGAVHGLDSIFFTDQEKAEVNEKVSEWYLRYLETTQPQNLARRYIALSIVGLWAGLIVFGVVAYVIERAFGGEGKIAEFVFKVLNDLVHQPFMMIMGFYFLTHVVRTYTNGKKGKK